MSPALENMEQCPPSADESTTMAIILYKTWSMLITSMPN